MEFTGRIIGIKVDGKPEITLTINETEDAKAAYDEFNQENMLSIEIDKFRPKRSYSANAYFWLLCGKLAAKIGQKKTDVYKEFIREIGDNYKILRIEDDAVDDFIHSWQEGRTGWICDILGESDIQGYTDVCAYFGSSTYNSKQMSNLINLALQECEAQGIQTEPPEEIKKMKEQWRKTA